MVVAADTGAARGTDPTLACRDHNEISCCARRPSATAIASSWRASTPGSVSNSYCLTMGIRSCPQRLRAFAYPTQTHPNPSAFSSKNWLSFAAKDRVPLLAVPSHANVIESLRYFHSFKHLQGDRGTSGALAAAPEAMVAAVAPQRRTLAVRPVPLSPPRSRAHRHPRPRHTSAPFPFSFPHSSRSHPLPALVQIPPPPHPRLRHTCRRDHDQASALRP